MDTTDSVSRDPEMKRKYEEYERLKNKALDNAMSKAQKKYESPNTPGAAEEVRKILSKDIAAKQSMTLLKEIQTIKNKDIEHRLRNTLGDMYDRPINSPANRSRVTYGQYAYNVANKQLMTC